MYPRFVLRLSPKLRRDSINSDALLGLCGPSRYGGQISGASRIWFLINHHFGDGGCERVPVEVKCSMHLTICRQGEVQMRSAEKAKGNKGLGY